MNVRLRRSLDVISGRPQDVRLGRPRDVRSERSRDGQIGSLGNVLGTSWGPIFAGWAMSVMNNKMAIYNWRNDLQYNIAI